MNFLPKIILSCLPILTFVFGEPVYRVKPSNMTVYFGSQVMLYCEVDNLSGGDEVQWTRNGFALGVGAQVQATYPRYRISRLPQGRDTLVISNAQLRDDGVYQCQVTGTHMRSSGNAWLMVLMRPRTPWIEGGQTITVTAGVLHNITCHADQSRPAAKVTWYRRGIEAHPNDTLVTSVKDSDRKRENTTSVYEFIPNRVDHDKHVRCVAENPYMPLVAKVHSNVKLHVLYPPEIQMSVDPMYTVQEGDYIHFRCMSDANPSLVTWKWYKGGVVIAGVNIDTFTLKVVPLDHNKNLVCEATNTAGSGNKTFNLDVGFGPLFGKQEHVEASVGDKVTLRCAVSGNPTPVLHWSKKGTDLHIGSKLEYTINGVREENFGDYLCQATVGQTKKQDIVKLLKKGPPKIVSASEQSGAFGSTGRIECLVRAAPKPEVVWHKNNKRVTSVTNKRYSIENQNTADGLLSSIVISRVQQDDFAMYNCTVDNGYGTDSVYINYTKKDVVPLAWILAGVLAGVFIIIIVIVALFVYHKKKSNESDSDTASTSTGTPTKKKIDPTDIKVEYNTDSYDRAKWKDNYDQIDGMRYGPDYRDGYYGPYDRDYQHDPYGTYPGPPRNYDRYEDVYISNTLPPGYDAYRPASRQEVRPPSRQDYRPPSRQDRPPSRQDRPPSRNDMLAPRPPSRNDTLAPPTNRYATNV